MKKIALVLILTLTAVITLFMSLSAMAAHDAGTSGGIIEKPSSAVGGKAWTHAQSAVTDAGCVVLVEGFTTHGKEVALKLQNEGARDAEISEITISWPVNINGALEGVKLYDEIWEGCKWSSPATITPTKGTRNQRLLTASQKKDLKFKFEKQAAGLPYSITVSFEEGCSVSYEALAPPRPIKVRFEGTIQFCTDTGVPWVIGGITVTVDPNSTKINENKGKAEVEAWAEVLATQQPAGSLLATHIWIKAARGRGVEPIEFKGIIEVCTDTGVAFDSVIGGIAVRVDAQTVIKGTPYVGAMAEVCTDTGVPWVIGGIRVRLDAQTVIKGTPYVGAWAQVKAFLRSDGSILAQKIDANALEKAAAQVEFEGIIESIGGAGWGFGDKAAPTDVSTLSSVWIIGGTTVTVDANTVITGTPQVGAVAEVRGLEQADGSVLATEIEVEEAEGEEVEFEGIIEELPDHPRLHGDWVIDGTTVAVDGRTLIDESKATAEEANYAEVKAIRQADGSLLAIRIKVERHG